MFSKITLVVNPVSANRTTGKEWSQIAGKLKSIIGDFKWEFTTGPDTAPAIVRKALKAGTDIIVAVGGDGTLNEVVNGFFEEGRSINPQASLGVIARGTGTDFIKTAKIPKDLDEAAKLIAEGMTKRIDVGRATFKGHSGKELTRYFLNIADFGIGGETVARVNRTTKAFGGFLSFLWGATVTILMWKNKRVRLQIDDGPVEEKIVQNVVVANGQYFGGGMWVAPKAELSDGLFDIVIFGDISRGQSLRDGTRIYKGTHLEMDKVSCVRGKKVMAFSEERVLIDMDGEQPGILPATFEMVPDSLSIIYKGVL